jgi:hypothetical protein
MEEVRNSIGKMEEENKEAEGKAAIPCFPKCNSQLHQSQSLGKSLNSHTTPTLWMLYDILLQ